ncbi:MAG: hypothetical protein HFE51_06170 [Clostridia bacterium]|jgi:ABC-type glycerol-3-phosphate transport system substrate-binding protein|nr:hypothetical protein [Clostridia bacterium]MCI9085986.1 hypothetical protein [Clostridia bacterium]NDO18567.1 hypothetical protein [Lachnospiraceae bacterium MD329]
MKTKRLIGILTACMIAVAGLAGCGNNKADEPQQQTAEKVTPTFMYFISSKDADFDKTNEMIAELQSEYADEINFNIINVDTDTEALKNFPLVDGNTPALIMLNTSNDISAMEFKCSDKSKLKDDIKAALK